MMKMASRYAIACAVGLLLAACGGGGGAGDGGSGGGGSGGGGGGVSDVSNGVPSQRSMSISVGTYNLDWSLDGATTTVSVRVTDTAGNPVPDGTLVQFSTEGGQILSSCALTGVASGASEISECSVVFATQNVRPLDGRVSVLAWLEGQEAFIDANGNGRYDAGETFYDMGRLFRDDNGDGAYTAGVDELIIGGAIPAPGIGTLACSTNTSGFGFGFVPLSEPNSCDGAWGRSFVRANVEMAVSDPRSLGAAYDSATEKLTVYSVAPDGVTLTAAPAGTTIVVLSSPTNCTLTVSPATVLPNQVAPSLHTVSQTGTGCTAGAPVQFRLNFTGGYQVVVDATL